MTANTPTVVMFAIYLLGMLAIGWAGYKATDNLSDYILGGRSLGPVVTALSAGASDMSGWLLMGLPGAVFLQGLSASWIAIGLCLGAWLNWRFVAARLRIYTEKVGNALTLPDYFTNRFEDRSNLLRIVTALVILVFFTIYCASGVVAGARLFESMFGMDYQTALWVGAVATMAYVFIGGFLAVSWTDTIQASLMITALILAPLMVIYADGGVGPSAAIIDTARSGAFDMFRGQTVIAVISLLAWGLGYFGQPHILVRFMAAESVQTIPNARRIGMTWMVLCLGGAVAVGFFGIAFFNGRPDLAGGVNANAETVFLEVAKLLFNPWISGVLLAAVLAAVMSTLSCQLLVCSSALTQDIYKTFLRKQASERELVWFGRAMVFVIAVIAIVIAQDPESKVLGMVSNAWAGFGAAFGPLVLLSLLWTRMTRNGALAGMVVGAVTVLVWQHYQWFKLYEIVPGFVLSTVAIVMVSLLGKMPSAAVQKTHAEVEAEIAAQGE
ncbi:sodium/proline symporter PutP [Comamonas terrigena]|jgi:sodium/proline symporter|uniref:sodium/proline symporter PutP n=1 Tax=Comamonas terrigena TaxID=32013 RepID=UPI0023554268|nr:sodium/proline symporter PutP [Comamonas terrigena]MDH0047423.1 sodium/proline symporter PutP [Comamonas terrigena]MDH0509843.1 sodium/proline symporter PutP [Comamonas terrigena]MDH1089778.1 sodium/proline symporter PutP [Comamonas terrigena]MDH1291247.1 sodium/proline symporter PutP [Comamonas terrigena]MDH1501647.1 sodium/proline symporter PutP [Comamonas terrigena]